MKKLLMVAICFHAILLAYAQGFVNLKFESVDFITSPSQGFPFVTASNAIPGWTPYLGNFAQDYVASNGASLGGPQVNIEGTNNPFAYPSVQGKYWILLQGAGIGSGHDSAGIGQTAQVPASAQSILFWGSIFGSLDVSFNGNALPFAAAGTTANNYIIYQADISPYAGQIGELLFSAPFNANAIIDNIQFSSTAVPEPAALALMALGATLLFSRRKIVSCHQRQQPLRLHFRQRRHGES